MIASSAATSLGASSVTTDSVAARLDVYDQISDQPQAARRDVLVSEPGLGNLLVGRLTGGATGIALPKPVGELKLFLDDHALAELWLAVTWGKQ